MISGVICFVISKKQKTRQRSSENMVRARSDQLLHVILERSLAGQPTEVTNIEENHATKTKFTKKKMYPVLGSFSDLESTC